ncbi:MAG: tetratricopeptide repeat protein [Pseudomonadota bacterium]|nr:tetratricopeptide repeat protein [Pseudomonadota bacterium]
MSSLHQGSVAAYRVPATITAVLLLLQPVSSLALSPQEVFAATAPSVAALVVLDSEGQPVRSYSATQVDAHRFVSVCDGLDPAQTVRLSLKSVVLTGKVSARDRERNLCLIEADGAPAQALVVQKQAPMVGSRVFAVSNALGLGVGFSEGVVSGVRHFPTGDYIQFTASISPGSEGGALVDAQGQWLGIADYRHRDGQNVNFASISAWALEVEQRAADQAEQLARFDAATALQKQQEWADLEAFSLGWRQREPDSADAWRFAIAAAKGLQHADAELAGWQALYRIGHDQWDAGLGLGQALLERRRTEEAVQLAQQLVTEHPEYAQTHELLARAQLATGSRQEAEGSYRRAIALAPWLIDAYQGLAALAQARGDSATAISIWSRLSGLYPDALGPRSRLIQAYLAAGQAAHAYSTLEKLPETDRDSAMGWYWRGVTLSGLKCPEAAVQAYRKSIERQPDPAATGWAWAGIGEAMAEMQRHSEAIAAFESASKAQPNDDGWRYQLAVNLKDGGRASEALTITKALTEKAPATAAYWRQHGFVLAVLGRPLEAIPAMERSLQIDPQQSKVWRALIETQQVAGRRQDARETYQKLRAIDTPAAEDIYHSALLPYEGEAP